MNRPPSRSPYREQSNLGEAPHAQFTYSVRRSRSAGGTRAGRVLEQRQAGEPEHEPDDHDDTAAETTTTTAAPATGPTTVKLASTDAR